jgi:hypothetical protein
MQARFDLYGPTGTWIAYNGTGDRATSSITLPATGLYTIVATDFAFDETGAYDLNLQFTTGRCAEKIFCDQTSNGSITSLAQ